MIAKHVQRWSRYLKAKNWNENDQFLTKSLRLNVEFQVSLKEASSHSIVSCVYNINNLPNFANIWGNLARPAAEFLKVPLKSFALIWWHTDKQYYTN